MGKTWERNVHPGAPNVLPQVAAGSRPVVWDGDSDLAEAEKGPEPRRGSRTEESRAADGEEGNGGRVRPW